MIVCRQEVFERLKRGDKLYESGNTMLFKDGNSCHPATDSYLIEQGLVKITGKMGRRVYSWLAHET